MRVISNKDLQNPNVCIICEEHPLTASVIDCERYTPDTPRFKLNGRKYICENCGNEIAKRLGYIPVLELDAAKEIILAHVTSLDEKEALIQAQNTLLAKVYGGPVEPHEVKTIEGKTLPGTDTPPARKAGRPRKVIVPIVDEPEVTNVEVAE